MTVLTLGQIVATPGAMALLETEGVRAAELLRRHAGGDWGDLDAEDNATNERAVLNGSRVLSAYTLPQGGKVWVITEADRSVTTILLPEDY